MKKTLRARYAFLVAAAVSIASLAVGLLCLKAIDRRIEFDNAQIMNLGCRNAASQLNDALDSVEHSVNTADTLALLHLEGVESLQVDQPAQDAFTNEVEDILRCLAEQTVGASVYYFRYNPNLFSPLAGFFYAKDLSGKYRLQPTTDLSLYDSTDTEHVAWYYEPVKAGDAIWLAPYWNDNLGLYMVSYVTPLFLGETILGVIGMDIDLTQMLMIVEGKTLYKSGYAFLMSPDGDLISHPYLSSKESYQEMSEELSTLLLEKKQDSSEDAVIYHKIHGENHCVVYTFLKNGMCLVMVAKASEIYDQKIRMAVVILMITIISAFVFGVLGIIFAGRMTRPLDDLTSAARQMLEGDLDLHLMESKRQDEIGELSRTFLKTANYLKHYIEFIRSLAYHDSLTGFRNQTAYESAVTRIQDEMELGIAQFAMIMADLNYLKRINDTYGHEKGNAYLLNLSKVIKGIFLDSCVYRIGGDEFLILLEGQDYRRRDELFSRLQSTIQKEREKDGDPWDRVSAAIGIAVYDPAKDTSTQDVFKRADERMYENKVAMRAQRTN